jgi:transcriptional regulator with XRE-family HTH domain
MQTRATAARLAAGLGLAEAARRARISVGYLRQVERSGANFSLATRLSNIYQCPIDTFLVLGYRSPKKRARRCLVASSCSSNALEVSTSNEK